QYRKCADAAAFQYREILWFSQPGSRAEEEDDCREESDRDCLFRLPADFHGLEPEIEERAVGHGRGFRDANQENGSHPGGTKGAQRNRSGTVSGAKESNQGSRGGEGKN